MAMQKYPVASTQLIVSSLAQTLSIVSKKMLIFVPASTDRKMDPDKESNDVSRTQQHLANQRTFLAWLRTSVALIGLGDGVAEILRYEYNVIDVKHKDGPKSRDLSKTWSEDIDYHLKQGHCILKVERVGSGMKTKLQLDFMSLYAGDLQAL